MRNMDLAISALAANSIFLGIHCRLLGKQPPHAWREYFSAAAAQAM